MKFLRFTISGNKNQENKVLSNQENKKTRPQKTVSEEFLEGKCLPF
jgi:hypothetical protein